jgi:hypothetical protein
MKQLVYIKGCSGFLLSPPSERPIHPHLQVWSISLKQFVPPSPHIMRFTQAFLSLLTGASAIEITLHVFSNSCVPGNALHCGPMNPDNCCGYRSNDFESVEFDYIPTTWKLLVKGYNNGNCNRRKDESRSGGRSRVCLVKGPFSGGGYQFTNKKRDASNQEACTDIFRPDTASFTDGTRYNLTALDDDSYAEMVCIQSL